MGNTDIYKLGFLEAFQKVGEVIDMDERRFRTIEAQTYAIYTIFGNGVLDDDPLNPSWRIQNVPGDITGQIVQITPGGGHVAWKSAITTDVTQVKLPPPSGSTTGNLYTFWIYARANDTTHDKRTVDFVASTVEINDFDNYIGLGAVVVDYGSSPPSVTCYNDADHGRVNISLFNTLASLINKHKHIGGANNPSRVDLGLHVQGKLDGTFIENLDLGTVTAGNLAPERLPIISHTILADIGTLTHPEIDSLLETLENPSAYRLSDLHIANLLQLVLALKKQGGLSSIDSKLVNAIFYAPGYNADDHLIAYYSTFATYGLSGVVADFVPGPSGAGKVDLAIVDKNLHEIYGTNPSAINSDVIVWTTDLDFTTALENHQTRINSPEPYPHDIVISGVGINGEIDVDVPLEYKAITSTNLAASVNSFTWDGGYKFLDNKTQNAIIPPPPPTLTTPPFNNEFIDTYAVERYFFGTFQSTQDWSTRTKLGIGWGLSSISHPGDVFIYLIYDGGTATNIIQNGVSTTIKISSLVTLRDGGLQTSATRLYRAINLSEFNVTDMTKISGMGVAWKTATGWDGSEVDFYLLYPNDDEVSTTENPNLAIVEERQVLPDTTSSVFIWNDSLYAETAEIVFRFDSGFTTTTYSLLNWDITTPLNTQVKFRTRAGDNDVSMGAFYDVDPDTHLIDSNSSVGRYFDIHVKLVSAPGLVSAPSLQTLTLAFESAGVPALKTWNKKLTDSTTDQTGWMEGRSFVNILIGDDYVDGLLTKNSLTLESSNGVGEFQYIRSDNSYESFKLDGSDESSYQNGETLYTTPYQAWHGSIRSGYESPLDFEVLSDKSVVFADTNNDRLVHVDMNGNMIRSIQGNIKLRNIDRDFVALTADYNPRLGKIWIAFSQNITISDKSKIYLQSDQNSLSFSLSDINCVPFAPIDNKSATIQATLSSSLQAIVNSWTSPMKVLILNGAVTSAGSGGGSGGSGGSGGGNLGGGSGSGGGSGGSGGTGGSGSGSGGSGSGTSDCPPTGLYENLGTGDLAGKLACFTGLEDNTALSTDSGDFNGDGSITSVLQGPGGQISNITLNVFSGEIVYYNLFNPISVQVFEDTNAWLVSTAGADSVIRFDSSSVASWTIPSTLITMREGYGGSAYLLDNGNVLLAAPASDDDGAKGTLMVVNRATGNVPLFSVPIDGDPVRALPYTNSLEYWVVINDRSSTGSTSRLVRVNTSGKITWSWGSGVLTHPSGMSVLENGTLLVSE